MVIMVLYAIFSLLVQHLFHFVPITRTEIVSLILKRFTHLAIKMLVDLHSLMVMRPGVAENSCLFSKLSVQIIGKVLHAFLELFLEVIKRLVYVVHGFNGLFLIFLDFAKRMKKLINH